MAIPQQSLFGTMFQTPAQVEQAQQQRLFEQARQSAMMTPEQQGAFIAARSGQMTGRLLSGLAGYEDPELKKARDLQGIVNQVKAGLSEADQQNPAKVYAAMAKRASELGYTQEAMLLADEANRRNLEEQKMELERDRLAVSQGQLTIAQEQERRAKYKDNPYLMIEDAAGMAEDDPRRNALIQSATDAIGKADVEKRLKEAQIKSYTAQAAAAGGGKISSTFVSEDEKGNIVPLTDINGRLYTPDGRPVTKVRMAKESDLATIMRMQGGGGASPGGAAQDPAAAARAELERRRKNQ